MVGDKRIFCSFVMKTALFVVDITTQTHPSDYHSKWYDIVIGWNASCALECMLVLLRWVRQDE